MTLFSARKTFALAISRNYASTTVPQLPFTPLLHSLLYAIDCQSLSLSQQCHTQILTHGLGQSPFLATKIVSAYSICGSSTRSRLVFDSVEFKNAYLWNSLINGYLKNRLYNYAFDLFNEMCSSDERPDDYTLATLAKVSAEIGDSIAGKLIHGKSLRIGFLSDMVVANSLMSMYCRCGQCEESRRLFDEMPKRNSGSWNVLIAGYASSWDRSFDKEMWEAVKFMQNDGVKPDGFTVSSLLPVCGSDTGRWDHGRELHCFIVKNVLDSGLGSDVHLGCCLIDMYSRNNKVIMGRRVFDRMRCKNVYVWTAMINGYVQDGASDEAFILFHNMQVKDGIEPNSVSLVSILPACGSHGGLLVGKQIHGFAIRKELDNYLPLCNALIDMYSKCGSLVCARRVFEDDSFCKDVISWSSMISGYGLHGRGKEAVLLYEKMLQLGIKPDMITVVGVLSACGRSGLVTEGFNIYSSVLNVYGIEPTVEMCACVVDLLGRSGQLNQALDFIKSMPLEPGPSVWGALVSASVMHGNSEMQDLAYRCLIQVEPKNPSNYISLSNLYATSRRWDVVAEVRTMMKERGLRKAPGCSWISVNGNTHCFYVADKLHPCSNSIYEMLDYLLLIMTGAGSSPDVEDMI
ncbi:pentatricopeptide repeat-containing protein At1g28690, mitochondrial-like [Juglans microcarpa x Juglans regia]|uniref:pentatricopeptide repeat-containing protein At1g28690, mitochondrial-like n=1 Tax=Juglans microcarpa x Juglans regia TaxID=2249226 RepID=UPI001B7E6003|nr:pentatricopeptide repeat-containing protein At1g28690, mitochondrial-like [Juglans microcarpa x Juglans regia]